MHHVLIAGLIILTGCNQIPGTSAYKIDQAQKVAAKDLIDPSSAQFRSVRVGDKGVCGEINAKNRMNAYVGFKRWVAMETTTQPEGWLAQIDPEFDPSEKARAEDFCASVQSNSYSSGSLITSACERAQEQRLNELGQKLFDGSWKSICDGKPS